MAIPPTKLTEAFIRNLTCEDKPFLVRDTIIKGLIVGVNKHSKAYKKDSSQSDRGRAVSENRIDNADITLRRY